jgi:hypothetical protein
MSSTLRKQAIPSRHQGCRRFDDNRLAPSNETHQTDVAAVAATRGDIQRYLAHSLKSRNPLGSGEIALPKGFLKYLSAD